MKPLSLQRAVDAFQAAPECEGSEEYGLNDRDVAAGLRAMFTALAVPFEDDWSERVHIYAPPREPMSPVQREALNKVIEERFKSSGLLAILRKTRSLRYED